jgi:hypothetical protein
MVTVLQPSKITNNELVEHFRVHHIQDDPSFFPEWETDLPELSDSEKISLDKVRSGYSNLIDHASFSEKSVQILILGPLLFLADCFLPPFKIHVEKSIEISDELEDGVVIRGQLDIVLIKDGFWVMAIESKRPTYSIEAGLPQLVSYLLAHPNGDLPCYGMVTTGGEFIFVKLVRGEVPQYATSDLFILRRRHENQLHDVFRILKRLTQI